MMITKMSLSPHCSLRPRALRKMGRAAEFPAFDVLSIASSGRLPVFFLNEMSRSLSAAVIETKGIEDWNLGADETDE